jgi:hypothetical protein
MKHSHPPPMPPRAHGTDPPSTSTLCRTVASTPLNKPPTLHLNPHPLQLTMEQTPPPPLLLPPMFPPPP